MKKNWKMIWSVGLFIYMIPWMFNVLMFGWYNVPFLIMLCFIVYNIITQFHSSDWWPEIVLGITVAIGLYFITKMIFISGLIKYNC